MNEDVKNLIKISSYRGLSHNEEKVILEYLKSISEAESFEMLKYMVDQKSVISSLIAKRVLHNKDYIKSLFKYGILNSNAQSIKQWLEFAIHKIGFRTAVNLIKEMNTESNKLMEKALYWLPIFISKNDTKSRIILDNLKEEFNEHDSIYEQ